MLDALAIAVNGLVWGAHALLPWGLARGDAASRRKWSLVALPALLASLLLTILAVDTSPDAAIAWRLTSPLSGSPVARVVAIAFLAAAATDVVLFLASESLEPMGWRIAGALGFIGLVAESWAGELLRTGEGPRTTTLALAISTLTRGALALAAAEAVAPSAIRRRWSLVAALAFPISLVAYHPALRIALGADRLTLIAGSGCFLFARFLPPRASRLARAAGLAGWLLAALFFSAAASRSGALAAPTPIEELP